MLRCRFGYNAPMSGSENESQVRCGEWELVQEIGRGAYGVVYRTMGPGGALAAEKVCRRGDVGTNGGCPHVVSGEGR